MNSMKEIISILEKNGFVFALLLVGCIIYVSYFISKKFTNNHIPGAAIAISFGLVLAYFGGEKGFASVPGFSGLAFLGGTMMRDFAIVSTAMGAKLAEIKNRIYWIALSFDRNCSRIFCGWLYRLRFGLYR